MIVIQILLIAAVLATMFYFLRSYSSRTRALTKIAAILFSLLAISAILFPDLTGVLAQLVGVGRGTDLVLYCLVIVVGFMVVNDNLHRRREEQRFAKLIRHITLMEAPQPPEQPKKLPSFDEIIAPDA